MSSLASLPADLRVDQEFSNDLSPYVVLAEFDIDKGSVIRAQLPCEVPVGTGSTHLLPASPLQGALSAGTSWSTYLADQLLPDGTERFDFAVSWFVVNRAPAPRRWSCVASKFCLPPGGGDWVCESPWCCVSVTPSHVVMTDCRGVQPEDTMSVRTLTFHPMPSQPKGSEQIFGPPKTGLEAGDVADMSTDERIVDKRETRVFIMLRDGDSVTALLFHSATDYDHFSARVASNAADLDTSQPPLCNSSLSSQPVGHEPLYGLSCTMTKKDASVRRGSINKGVAVLSTRIDWLSGMIPALQCAVETCCCIYGWTEQSEAAQRSVLQHLLDTITQQVVPRVQELTQTLRASGVGGKLISDSEDANRECVPIALDPSEFQSYVPPRGGVDPEAAADAPTVSPASPARGALKVLARPLDTCINVVLSGAIVLELFETLGSDMLKVFVAALADRRIMFIARHLVATRVSNACLAVGIVMESVMPSFIANRVFPYSGITSTPHFESRPGYIFGTLNPIFEGNRPKRFWDLSVDIEKKALTSADADLSHLWDDLNGPIVNTYRRLTGIVARAKALGKFDHSAVERAARLEIRSFLENCVTAATATPHIAMQSRALLQAHAAQQTSLFSAMRRKERRWVAELTEASNSGQWNSLVSVLQRGLRHCATPEGLHHLLYQLPEWSGGLTMLGELLFHPDPTVLLLVVALLRRIDSDPVGRRCISRLNSFMLFAFEQVKQELPDTAL